MRWILASAIIVHIFAAIGLVGGVMLNTLVLWPAMKRVPPAQSAVVHTKVGSGLMWMGFTSLILLGVSGLALLWGSGILTSLARPDFWLSSYGWRLALMVGAWLALLFTSGLAAYWNRTVLEKKLPYTAGLRELEERRAAQQRVSDLQERLAYTNLGLTLLAALGGALLRAGI
jgi:hypothetical protein